MFSSTYNNMPPAERMIVFIDEIDLANRRVFCKDRTGARISAFYHAADNAFRVPKSNERWTVRRHGWTWYLDKKLDDPNEVEDLANLSPGDTRIQSSGMVRVVSESFELNNIAVGGTVLDVIQSDGTDSITISAIPVHPATVQVFHSSGFLHQGVDYNINGRTITFISTPNQGDLISVYFQRSGRVFSDETEVQSQAQISAVETYNE